tara:strand:- start:919 stop:2484 length:1566 start_codon:yes stop_codon:yes gene_type:complete
MQQVLKLTNEMCRALVDVERAGIKIDIEALDKLEHDYRTEYAELERELNKLAADALGDTPFKLSSNDDLSMLIFSRRPKDKKQWAKVFNLGTEVIRGQRKKKQPVHMTKDNLANSIVRNSFVVRKTQARQCPMCKGTGKVARYRKDGTLGAARYNCASCNATGIQYTALDEVAGFKCMPTSVNDLAAHGYSCSKTQLEKLSRRATGDAKDFLTKMVRFNAIAHYLSNFVDGIRRTVGRDGVLHSQYMQCVTATGRLSSRNPNFQNMPRGNTFPLRAVCTSRWADIGGSILDADYSQLEFRVAADLSRCPVALGDIIKGVDVHQRTAETMTNAGQPTSRQDAKSHTFKPLYGGMQGNNAEQTYYKSFLEHYRGIKRWHTQIVDNAAAHKSLCLPTGRKYKFPWAKVNTYGNVAGATKIKNYPVQGFATADIVPLATVNLWKAMQGMKSLLINQVHDSLVVDCYPGEEKQMIAIMRESMLGVLDELSSRFKYEFSVPLAIEVKQGPNWLDMETVLVASHNETA